MKLRHAAALALVGWYLITPPDCSRPNDRLNCQSHFPLGSWQIIDVFDTAVDCKAAQEKWGSEPPTNGTATMAKQTTRLSLRLLRMSPWQTMRCASQLTTLVSNEV